MKLRILRREDHAGLSRWDQSPPKGSSTWLEVLHSCPAWHMRGHASNHQYHENKARGLTMKEGGRLIRGREESVRIDAEAGGCE